MAFMELKRTFRTLSHAGERCVGRVEEGGRAKGVREGQV